MYKVSPKQYKHDDPVSSYSVYGVVLAGVAPLAVVVLLAFPLVTVAFGTGVVVHYMGRKFVRPTQSLTRNKFTRATS
ncbi:MAG: hypothetical protein ABEI86_10685 [Halobacteriaceae archaeon]